MRICDVCDRGGIRKEAATVQSVEVTTDTGSRGYATIHVCRDCETLLDGAFDFLLKYSVRSDLERLSNGVSRETSVSDSAGDGLEAES